ncbi:hypothetical protein V1519DRAFT_480522 [Lipomyces tetrasporus]
MPLRSVHRAQRDIYRDPENQRVDMSADARMFQPADEQLEPANNAAVVRARDVPTRSDAGYNMIDDDEQIALDTGRKVLCRDLTDGQVVYCPLCETTVDRTAGSVGKWVLDCGVGDPSAAVTLTVVIQCADQYGFVAERDEMVHLGGNHKINWEGQQDIFFW